MGKEEGDVEPGNEIEKEKSRNERVLGRDQIKDEHSNTGQSLAEREPMLAEQFALKKISFRTFAAEGFTQKPDNEGCAVDAVAMPGQVRARRIKSDHEPDANPEETSHDRDLAKQKNAIQSLGPLGDHGYRLRSNSDAHSGKIRSVARRKKHGFAAWEKRNLIARNRFHRN